MLALYIDIENGRFNKILKCGEGCNIKASLFFCGVLTYRKVSYLKPSRDFTGELGIPIY